MNVETYCGDVNVPKQPKAASRHWPKGPYAAYTPAPM